MCPEEIESELKRMLSPFGINVECHGERDGFYHRVMCRFTFYDKTVDPPAKYGMIESFNSHRLESGNFKEIQLVQTAAFVLRSLLVNIQHGRKEEMTC